MISDATVGPMLIPLRQHLNQPNGRRWLRFNAFIIVNYWYNLALNLVKNHRFSVPGKYPTTVYGTVPVPVQYRYLRV